jgi:phage terminase small subunit
MSVVRAKKTALTAKEERFCIEVVEGKPYTEAYKIAGYADYPTSRTALRQHASRIRAKPHVAARIAELQAMLVERCLLTKQEWFERMDRMARADVRKLFNPQGDLLPVHEIGSDEAELITGLEVEESFTKVEGHAEHTGYIKKVKLASKLQILKEYGEARGWRREEEKTDGPKRLVIREWVRHEEEEHHVRSTDSRADDDGVRGGGAATLTVETGAAASRVSVEAGASPRSRTDGGDGGTSREGAGLHQSAEAAGRERGGGVDHASGGHVETALSEFHSPATADAARVDQLQHHEHGARHDQHELLVSQHRTRTVRVREIVAEEEDA